MSTPVSSGMPLIHIGAFLRTLIAPLIVWSVGVIICAGLSALTASLTLQRYAREANTNTVT